ncbi:MAG: tail fiber domain-containing protein [Candidatus Thiodiazotropha endolucinida]
MGLFGSSGNKAAKRAAEAQVKSTQLGVDELRRQFDTTQGNLSPFINAGQGVVGDVTGAGTVGGLNERLAAIMGSDMFGALIEERERAVQNQLARSGMRRSGLALREAADIPTGLALAVEQALYGRQAGLMGSGQNAAAGLGALGASNSGNIANLFSQMGQSQSNAILQGQQANAQRGANLLAGGLAGANIAAGLSGATAGTIAGGAGLGTLAASLFSFSDERMKKNMQPLGEINGLTLYQWEWKDDYKGMTYKGQEGTDMTIGFNAQEVERKYPEYVREINGFKAINYTGLIQELQ